MSIRKIKASANYERIKNSLELRVARNYALLFAAAAVLTALLVFLINFQLDAGAAAIAAGFMALVLLPFSLFYVHRIFKIYQNLDDYTFTEVTLDRLGHSLYKGMHFSVDLKDWDGQTVQTQTHSLFHTHGIMEPLLEDYVNRTVLVGYNNTTGYVAVIG